MSYSTRSCLCGFTVVAVNTPTPRFDAHLAVANHEEQGCIYPPPRSHIRRAWPYQMETA